MKRAGKITPKGEANRHISGDLVLREKNAGPDLINADFIKSLAKTDSPGRRDGMWVCIASLMAGVLIGFFTAALMASSQKLSEFNRRVEEAAANELYDHA